MSGFSLSHALTHIQDYKSTFKKAVYDIIHVSIWGGRWEGGSGWGTRVHPWRIHVDIWQNQYSIAK